MGKVAPIGVALLLLALVGCGGNASTTTVTSGTTAAPAVTQATTTTTAATTTTTMAATTTTAATQSVTLKWGETFLNQKVTITIAPTAVITYKDGSKGVRVEVTMKNLSQEPLYYSQMVFVLFDTLGSSFKMPSDSGGEPYDNEQPGKTMYESFGLAGGAQPKSVVVTWPEILGDTQLIWQ